MIWQLQRRFLNKSDSAATDNEEAQTNYYNTLTSNYSSDYSQFEGLQSSLMNTLSPIVNAGPSQYGFSTGETNALNSSAINAGAASTNNAQVAANQQIIAANGGSAAVPTGAQEELMQQADLSGAQSTASALNNIQLEGYQQGTTNYNNALSGEMSILSADNPNAWASSTTSAGSAATGSVNALTSAEEADNSWETALSGAIGGIGSTVLGASKLANPTCWVAAELYGGWDDPRTDLIREWIHQVYSKTLVGEIFYELYIEYGARYADYIKTHKYHRKAAKALFDRFLKKAQRWRDGNK